MKMTTYEYKIFDLRGEDRLLMEYDEIEKTLNELGAEGWHVLFFLSESRVLLEKAKNA